jgi:hypothetical protein
VCQELVDIERPCGGFIATCWRTLSLFDVGQKMHLLLGKWPTWRTNFFQCIYLFTTLYMFRARRAHHQERQIVLIQFLETVTLWTKNLSTLLYISTKIYQNYFTFQQKSINITLNFNKSSIKITLHFNKNLSTLLYILKKSINITLHFNKNLSTLLYISTKIYQHYFSFQQKIYQNYFTFKKKLSTLLYI